jgi:outer membrane protein assembly factor BamA
MRCTLLTSLTLCASIALLPAWGADPAPDTQAPPPPEDDGWFDVSDFLDEKYGFLPLLVPITEPAVGYGAAGGLAFIDQPLGQSIAGHTRPDVTFVGGLATENDTWGALAGDVRYWLDGRLQTLVGVIYSSVNLDFFGIGEDEALADEPLRYNLEPKGGTLQAKYRLGDSHFWTGLNYAFVATEVSFDAPPGSTGLPTFGNDTDIAGITPSVTFDTRDNIFTPLRGTYVEGSVGLFGGTFGGDDDFERYRLLAMQFFPLGSRVYLGARGDAISSSGDVPFYLRPFISMRGIPMLRYQGEKVAQLEAELRWQFWKRISVVGFGGVGTTWTDKELSDDSESAPAYGTGFRYEIARRYGIHMGLDVARGPEDTAIYIQFGSAWLRP